MRRGLLDGARSARCLALGKIWATLGLVTAVAIAAAAGFADSCFAQTEVAPEDVSAIASSLNCPLCQGYNLQDCPLEVCERMREIIAERLAAGDTRDEIVAGFVADYGPQILNAPPRTGFLAAAWAVPPLAWMLGIVCVALVARASLMRSRPQAAKVRQAAPGEGYAAEIERLALEDGDD